MVSDKLGALNQAKGQEYLDYIQELKIGKDEIYLRTLIKVNLKLIGVEEI